LQLAWEREEEGKMRNQRLQSRRCVGLNEYCNNITKIAGKRTVRTLSCKMYLTNYYLPILPTQRRLLPVFTCYTCSCIRLSMSMYEGLSMSYGSLSLSLPLSLSLSNGVQQLLRVGQ
jgi:hypothetical protein